jgi:hypothetical protein
MLRHVIEKRKPAVGILAIREAIRANVRIRELEALAGELLEKGNWTEYPLGSRPQFDESSATGKPIGGEARDGKEPAVRSLQEGARRAHS